MTLKEHFKQRLMNALVESEQIDPVEKKPYPPGTRTDKADINISAMEQDKAQSGPEKPGFVKGSQGRTLRERGVKIAEPEGTASIPELIAAPFEYYGRKLGNTLQRAIGRPETYHKHVPSSRNIKPQG